MNVCMYVEIFAQRVKSKGQNNLSSFQSFARPRRIPLKIPTHLILCPFQTSLSRLFLYIKEEPEEPRSISTSANMRKNLWVIVCLNFPTYQLSISLYLLPQKTNSVRSII